jgi:ubiquinone/menaquinone biosynthesis C-methylase UbiE
VTGDPTRPPTGGRWFEAVAAHAGRAYLRYSFTKGTEQEAAFLVDALGLGPGSTVLDVGCGPGRHAHALAARGIDIVGADIAERFLELAAEAGVAGASFVRADARALPVAPGAFDAAVSLCQGGFGLMGGPDGDAGVLAEMARAVRPGGVVAVSAFSAYFQVRWLGDGDDFHAGAGVNHERAAVRDEAGTEAAFDLWTSVFTPRELRLLARVAGLEAMDVWSVRPGEYARRPPDVGHEEYLMVARRPGGTMIRR